MKKLLSTIMALVMLLSLVPMAVATEGVELTEANSEAQINGLYYKTLDDAVSKVDNGDTIKLVNDVTVSSPVVIPAGKEFTLDLGGKKLTNSETAIINNGTLTVDNGTIESTSGVGIGVGDNSKTTILPGVTINSREGAVITSLATGATITINGGNFLAEDNAVIAGNGTGRDGKANIITINGGTFTGNIKSNGYIACGIYAPWKDVITVNGGTFTVNNGIGVVCRAGQVRINGGTFICNGSAKGKVGDKNFDMDAAQALYFDDSNPSYPAYDKDTDGIFVKGGAFTDLASAVKYATNGATITLAEDANASDYVEVRNPMTIDLNGHKFTSNGGGFDVYADLMLKNGKVETLGWAAWVQSGAKLVVDTDVAIKTTSTAGNQGGITVQNSGSVVTVYGSVEAAGGAAISGIGNKADGGVTINIEAGAVIKNTNEDGVGIYYPNTAALNIKGGTITGATGVYVKSGKTTITGGTINGVGAKADYKYYGNGCSSTGEAFVVDKCNYPGGDPTVEIKGGTFVSKNADAVGSYVGNNATNPLTGFVTGGKFSSNPSVFVADTNLVVVPNVGKTEYTVQPKTSEEGNATTTTEVSEDGKTVTETKTDGNTVTKTETNVDTGVKTETKTETKTEGNVTTNTETVTVKDNEGNVTKATETVTTEKTENGGTTTVVTKKDTLNKTETTEVTGVTAPTTAADVTLDVKNTTSVAVDKAAMTALKGDTVKDVVIEIDQATLKLDKTAVKTMEGKVAADGKMTLNVKVTEEKNASKTEIEKIMVEVTAVNEAGQNVFPKDTEKTNGKITITIPYTGTATQLDLWYTTDSGSIYMGRFPVVKGFVSFDVKHFSQYDLIPVASSGSSVIKTGAGSSAASTTQTVTTDLTPGSITKVTVDGKVVDAKYYTVSGSNVTFTAEFLKTLKNGSHTVTVENATKIAKGVFTVNNPTTAVQAPTTADAGIALYAGMAIASVMGTGVVFTSRKRKNH